MYRNYAQHQRRKDCCCEFHGDNGAGIGASHQTGWSGLVVNLTHYFAVNTQESLLARGLTGPAPNVRQGDD